MHFGFKLFSKEKLSRPANFQVKRGLFGKRKNLKAIALWLVAVGIAFYPIYIYPLYNIDKYRKFHMADVPIFVNEKMTVIIITVDELHVASRFSRRITLKEKL